VTEDQLWELAKVTQFWGVATAWAGFFAYLQTTKADGTAEMILSRISKLIVPFGLTVGILGLAELWQWFGKPEWYIPFWADGPTLNIYTFIALGAYINSFSLAWMVSIAGGVNGLFTPLFLLVPHTTAVFLDDTKYQINVPIVLFGTMALYAIVFACSDEPDGPKIERRGLYITCSALVLFSSIMLELFLVHRMRFSTAFLWS
jgi:hypothetical protein